METQRRGSDGPRPLTAVLGQDQLARVTRQELTAAARLNIALGPVMLLFGRELLLAPYVAGRNPTSGKVLSHDRGRKVPLELFQLSDADFAEVKKMPTHVLIRSSITAPTNRNRPAIALIRDPGQATFRSTAVTGITRR